MHFIKLTIYIILLAIFRGNSILVQVNVKEIFFVTSCL